MGSQRSWRGCKDWIDFGYPLSTTSDTACKMFDASISQLYGFYEDPSVGGLNGSMKATLEADPEFVMGHVVKGLLLSGTKCHPPNDPVRLELRPLFDLAEKKNLTESERKHVEVTKAMLDGDSLTALRILDDILVDNPFDVVAIRSYFYNAFFWGKYAEFRDVMSRVISAWDSSMPLYGYLLGIHAFGLEETQLYERATIQATKALEINQSDIYASHTLSHVNEMEGRPEKGLKLLKGSESNWNTCGMLACHMYWHWGLFHIEKGNYEESLGLYENEIVKRYKKNKSVHELVDSSTMLYRLELEGVSVKEEWKDLHQYVIQNSPEFTDHLNAFVDPQILMTSLGAKDESSTEKFLETFKDSIRGWKSKRSTLSQEVVLPLCEALVAYDNGDFEKTVDLIYPIRYDMTQLGGSAAQRDVFNLLMIHAAIKSPNVHQNKLARCLLAERKTLKDNSPMTERLLEKVLISHSK